MHACTHVCTVGFLYHPFAVIQTSHRHSTLVQARCVTIVQTVLHSTHIGRCGQTFGLDHMCTIKGLVTLAYSTCASTTIVVKANQIEVFYFYDVFSANQ